MTYEKAKDVIIRTHIQFGRCHGKTLFFEALRKALEAINKQIPRKPNYEGDGYDDAGNLIYDTWICPNCEDRYELDYEIHAHCPTCGQAIDWSEGNDRCRTY